MHVDENPIGCGPIIAFIIFAWIAFALVDKYGGDTSCTPGICLETEN